MKKLVLICAALLAVCTSCHKPEVGDGRTSYTFVNKVVPLDGLGINAWIYEYDAADQRIDSNYIEAPKYNHDYTFYPNDSCHHLKAKVFSSEKDRWSPTVFLIRPGENIRIEVSLQTEYAFREPEYHE